MKSFHKTTSWHTHSTGLVLILKFWQLTVNLKTPISINISFTICYLETNQYFTLPHRSVCTLCGLWGVRWGHVHSAQIMWSPHQSVQVCADFSSQTLMESLLKLVWVESEQSPCVWAQNAQTCTNCQPKWPQTPYALCMNFIILCRTLW